MSKRTHIAVDKLTVGFDDTAILKDISFEVMAGEIFIILGGSGSGKSTLLKHLIGLHDPLSGGIRILGRDLITASEEERKDLLRQIGVTYQSGALFGSRTLLENVCLPLEELTDLPGEARRLIGMMKLSLVGLEKYAEYLPSEASGGMQKRAGLARAMALDPQILFLDEPSAGLDPITSAELDQLILNLSNTLDITFVVVTHELPSIYTIADRVILLDKKTRSIIASGTPEDLRDRSENPYVQQFFRRKPLEPASPPSREKSGTKCP